MIISKYFGTGGHDIVINNLCTNLQKIGYDMAIGAFSFVNEPPENIKKIKLKKFRNISSSEFKPDLIHSHQTHMNYYSLFSSVPFVFHYHGTASTIQEENLKFSSFLCRNKIHRIIAVSNSARNILMGKIGKIPVNVVYNGIDLIQFHEQSRKSSDKKPRLIFVGNLYEHKNVQQLIHAMPLILQKYPSAKLEIIGNGKEFQKLKKQIESKNLSNNIILLGEIPNLELNHKYLSSDIYISASTKEAFPMPLLESMACGKPLLLSNIEPHKEIISVSNAGEIFANTNEITEKITKILENEKKYSDAARKFAKKHSWENIAKEIDKIYMEVLSK